MVSIEVETDDWLAKTIQCELEGTKLFEVNWMEGRIMRAGQRESSNGQGIRSVSPNESSASQSGSLKLFGEVNCHM